MKDFIKYFCSSLLILFTASIIACGGGGGGGGSDSQITGITLNTNSVSLLVGVTQQLTVTFSPADAENQDVTWESTNPIVASVNSSGLVEALTIGSTIITVRSVEGNKTSTCNVTVTGEPVTVIGVTLDRTDVTIEIDGTVQLNSTINPGNATNPNVTWDSSDTSVATVSSSGLVTGLSEGTSTITVTTVDGNKTAECTLHVNAAAVTVTGISLNTTSATLHIDETLQLNPIIEPENATNPNVTWDSSDTSVATISSSGLVTGRSDGTSTITVTTVDGNKTAECSVTVASEWMNAATFNGYNTRLAIDSNGNIYVVYNKSGYVNIMKFDGSTWSNIETTDYSQGGSNLSIAIDSSNNLYILMNSGMTTTVGKFVGTKWLEILGVMTPGQPGGSIISSNSICARLAIGSDNSIYASYSDGDNSYKATVKKYNPNMYKWELVGSAGFSSGGFTEANLAVDSSNTPYLVYDDTSSGNVKVMKYYGTNWVSVGSSDVGTGSSGSIAFDSSNIPYVVFNSGNATVKKLNGTNWDIVGTAGFSAGSISYSDITFDSYDTPYVVYQDRSNSSKATVMKYSGTNWVTVGTAGISLGNVEYPDIEVSPSGIPYVVYHTYISGSARVEVMVFK